MSTRNPRTICCVEGCTNPRHITRSGKRRAYCSAHQPRSEQGGQRLCPHTEGGLCLADTAIPGAGRLHRRGAGARRRSRRTVVHDYPSRKNGARTLHPAVDSPLRWPVPALRHSPAPALLQRPVGRLLQSMREEEAQGGLRQQPAPKVLDDSCSHEGYRVKRNRHVYKLRFRPGTQVLISDRQTRPAPRRCAGYRKSQRAPRFSWLRADRARQASLRAQLRRNRP